MSERPDREELERMYIEERRSAIDIAREIGVHNSTVSKWLKKHEISREKPSKEKLNRLYNEERLNAIEIGDIFGVSSSTIYSWMNEHELYRRKSSEVQLSNIDSCLREAMQFLNDKEFDSLPGKHRLQRLGFGDLAYAIKNYHGGFPAFRNILAEHTHDEKHRLVPAYGSWAEIDFPSEIMDLMESYEFERVPTWNQLIEIGRKDFAGAIVKVYGGFRKLRKALGEEQIKRTEGLLDDFTYVQDWALKVMNKNGYEILPTANELNSIGERSLRGAIQRVSGFPAFRETLNERLGLPSEEERLESLLREYVGEEVA